MEAVGFCCCVLKGMKGIGRMRCESNSGRRCLSLMLLHGAGGSSISIQMMHPRGYFYLTPGPANDAADDPSPPPLAPSPVRPPPEPPPPVSE